MLTSLKMLTKTESDIAFKFSKGNTMFLFMKKKRKQYPEFLKRFR